MALNERPIRVFYSELSGRFYASSSYREEQGPHGPFVVITGKKYDVTDDIAHAVVKHDLEFRAVHPATGDSE